MALVGVLIVVSWHLVVLSLKSPHWQKIAMELGSIPQFDQQLHASHGSGAVVYTRYVEEGIGYFFCNGAGGKSRLLGKNVQEFYGWSPDDSRLAYGLAMPSGQMELIIADGKTGEKMAELQHPGFDWPPMYTWLSSRAFCYLHPDAGLDFEMIEQKPDGAWAKGSVVKNIAKNATCFTSVSDDSVAWLEHIGGVDHAVYSGTNQQWQVTLVNDNECKIIASDGRVLAGPTKYSQLVLQDYSGASEQLWTFTPSGTKYNIRNVGSGENMDDWGGGTNKVVGQWDADSAKANQLWQLIGVGRTSTPTTENGTIVNGTYEFNCPSGGNCVLNFSKDVMAIRQLEISSGSVRTIWESPTENLSGSSMFVMGINSMVSPVCQRQSRAWSFDTRKNDIREPCVWSPRTGC